MTKKSPKNCLLQVLYWKYCYSNLLASSCSELDPSVKKGRWLPNEKKLCQKYLFDFFGKLLFRWDIGLTLFGVLLHLYSLRLIIHERMLTKPLAFYEFGCDQMEPPRKSALMCPDCEQCLQSVVLNEGWKTKSINLVWNVFLSNVDIKWYYCIFSELLWASQTYVWSKFSIYFDVMKFKI